MLDCLQVHAESGVLQEAEAQQVGAIPVLVHVPLDQQTAWVFRIWLQGLGSRDV